jgi:uncharacterized membrane protein
MAEKRTIELEIKENFKQVEKDLNSLDKALDNTANSARDVNKSFEDVYGDLQPLTARMGEAEDRLYELGAAGDYTSNEYKNLLNTVGEYRKVQINTDLAVDAASMTLSQKLGGALGGVASGFELAQGSMALFGVEGENVQAALLKVQSAMALSQGLQGLKEAKTSFIALGDSAKKTAVGQSILTAATAAYTFVTTASTTGLKLFRLALISTGIGALIVGVGLLVANFDSIVGVVKKAVGWFGGLSGTMKNVISVMFPIIGIIRLVVAGLEAMGVVENEQEKQQRVRDEATIKRHHKRMDEIAKEKALRDKLHKTMKEAYDNQDKAANREIALLKAQGKDTTALERARLQATINYQTNLQNESAAIFNQNKAKHELTKAELYAIGVRNDDFKEYNKYVGDYTSRQNDLLAQNKEANEARKDAVNQLAIFEIEVRKRNAESQSNSNQQSINSDTKTAETKIDIARRLEDETLRIKDEGRAKELEALDLQYKRKKEDAEKELATDKDKVNKLAKLNAQAIDSRKADEKLINDKYDKLDKEKAAKALEDKIKLQDEQWYALQKIKNSQQEQELLDLQIAYDKEYELAVNNDILQKELTDKFNKDSAAINKKYADEKKAADQKLADEEIARAKAVSEQKQAIQNQGIEVALQGVQLIKNVFEKSKGVQKAAVIAESAIGIAKMIIATKVANAGALASPANILLPGSAAPIIALNNISTGIGIAANIAATAKALSSLGGGSAPSAPGAGGGGGGGGGSMTPQFNTVGNNGINQLAQLQQQPTQAYVVSGQVTSQQALDRNRQQNSSL